MSTVTVDAPATVGTPATHSARSGEVTITQYSRRQILGIWAAAAVPMGVLAWIVAPAIADGSDITSLAGPLIACLTAGLIWQFVLVAALVGYEQRTLRWSVVRDALRLRSPRSPRTGRVGGKTWLILVPLVMGFALQDLVPITGPIERTFGEIVASDAGQALFHGSWGLFALVITMFVFNSVLGEELLFRGVLLPRMNDAFGDRDWVANGVLFATYHLHMPWAIPANLLDMLFVSYPAKRYQSTWIGIAVHSAQSVVFTIVLLTIVL